MTALGRLDQPCSRHLRFRDLIACGETYERLAAGGVVDNLPVEAATWDAIARLAQAILDPVIDRFGPITLTYGFASPALARLVPGRIAPALDQHAGHERTRTAAYICPRLGQACDLIVPGTSSRVVGRFIAAETPFDRLYLYADDRPLHVSAGPENRRALVELRRGPSGRLVPRVVRTV